MKLKLKQVKEFTELTLSQEFAAELAALTIWNHYRDDDYKSRGFTLKNTPPKGVHKNGGSSCSVWRDSDTERGYVKTATGVKITTCLNDTVRIFEDGKVMANWRENDHGDYQYITRNVRTEEESPSFNCINITRQVEIVQLYLDHGFFILE